jgi:hypothetical protein
VIYIFIIIPTILTLILAIISIYIFLYIGDLKIISNLGNVISSTISALGFIWLIAGFIQQSSELKQQRRELRLQRESLDMQKEELKKMSKFNALEQIRNIIINFSRTLKEKNIEGLNSISDLTDAFIKGIFKWDIILNSDVDQDIINAYKNWTNIESACNEFLSTIVSSIKLYDKTIEEINLESNEDDLKYIISNYERIKDIPYIENHIDTAKVLAEHMNLLRPGRKLIQFEGLKAMREFLPNPNIIDAEKFNELKEEVSRINQNEVQNDIENIRNEE